MLLLLNFLLTVLVLCVSLATSSSPPSGCAFGNEPSLCNSASSYLTNIFAVTYANSILSAISPIASSPQQKHALRTEKQHRIQQASIFPASNYLCPAFAMSANGAIGVVGICTAISQCIVPSNTDGASYAVDLLKASEAVPTCLKPTCDITVQMSNAGLCIESSGGDHSFGLFFTVSPSGASAISAIYLLCMQAPIPTASVQGNTLFIVEGKSTGLCGAIQKQCTESLSFLPTIITFDDISFAADSYGPVPNFYRNLDWSNFQYTDAVFDKINYPGYFHGIVSGKSVGFDSFGAPAHFSSFDFNYTFDLVSIYLTAAWRNGLKVDIQGYVGGMYGALQGVTTVYVDTTGPTFVTFDSKFFGVDTVRLISSGGVWADIGNGEAGFQFIVDNISLFPHY